MKLKKHKIQLLGFICLLLCLLASLLLLGGCGECEHIESDWIVDVEATLDTEGSHHTICTKCGRTIRNEPIPTLSLTKKEITDKLRASVVKVYSYDYDGETVLAQGSGFFINKSGVFVTNAHVVENSYYLKVQTATLSTSLREVSHIYEFNKTADYAVCGIDGFFSSTPVEFAEEANIGDTVYSLGFPNDVRVMSTTVGTILDNNTLYKQTHYYSTDSLIDHGSSGGILANDKGKVIGITSGEFEDGTFASIKYSEFSQAVDKKVFLSSAKAPLEYFHKTNKVLISMFNYETYFDFQVSATPFTTTGAKYSVTIKLKDTYAKSKFTFDGTMNLTFRIETRYTYYKEGASFDTLQIDTDTKSLYFRFNSKQDLLLGKTETTTSSITISYLTKYHDLNITYSTDVFSLLGGSSITFYD